MPDTIDGSGSLFVLGTRLTMLGATGAPVVGAGNAYQTDALAVISIGLSYEDGAEIIKKNGSGVNCMYYKAPDTLKGGVVEGFEFCGPDPNVLKFAMGGDTIERASVQEVQTVTITGSPTGGTFTLTYSGQTTAGIAYNAAAAAVLSALEALSNLVPGDVVVGGGPGPDTPWTVTFSAALGNVAQMTADGAALTGGASPAVTVATTTGGVTAATIGYRAPQVGIDPMPNGLGVEFWTRAIDDGAAAAELPYYHWVLGRAYLRMSDNWTANGEDPLTPIFQGTTNQNANFGDGPVGDWPYPSDRVWQFARVATVPDLTPGLVTVLA